MRLPASCDLSALLTHLIAHLGCHPAINPALNSSLPGNAVQKRASTVDDAEDMKKASTVDDAGDMVGAGGMAVYAWDSPVARQMVLMPLLPHAHLPAQAHARTDAKEPEQGESEARIQVESQVDLQVEPTEPVVVAGGGAVKVLLFEPLVGLGTPEVEFLKPGAFTSAELDIIVSTVQSAIDSSSPFLLSLFSFSGGRVSQARRIHTRRA
ncbi:unnamed protein product [Closterium sp. NIES-65]|nr:unnamed protein product [Closterium sp. NIES-65]